MSAWNSQHGSGMGSTPASLRDTAEDWLEILSAPSTPESAPLDGTTMPFVSDHEEDARNGELLVRLHGDRIRYVHAWNSWLAYDGHQWQQEADHLLLAMTKDVAKHWHDEHRAAELQDADAKQVKHLLRVARNADKISGRKAMMVSAAAEPGVPLQHENLDADPYVLNVSNGTLDLRNGSLRSHRASDLLTLMAATKYTAEAEAPTWCKFLDTVLPDPEVRKFVQRAAGYSLLGVVREHTLLFLYGTGANGKSTFLETLLHVLGPYGCQAAPRLLMSGKHERHPTELADLFRKRLVITTELGGSQRWDEELLKQITGGDTVKARRMKEDFWSFTPTHTVWCTGNNLPRVTGTDEGIWRRLLVVPFTVEIPEGQRDGTLPEKLRAEASGVLRWLVDGCLAYQVSGLKPPNAVTNATKEYRVESDVLGLFIVERCVVDQAAKTHAGLLYEAYKRWCDSNGHRSANQTAFGRDLERRGITKQRSNGTRFRAGIGLLEDSGSAQCRVVTGSPITHVENPDTHTP